jgi:hypothetical protein
VVLYGCEAWALTLREEQRLRVFENRMLRRIFGSKRDEVTGYWRKLHNEELYNLYNYNYQDKEDEMGRACSTNGENRNAYRIKVGKKEGKKPLGRPRRKWVNNINTCVLERYVGMVWIGSNLAQNRNQWRALVKAAMNLRVP